MSTGDGEKYCLRWNDFTTNLSSAFNELRGDEDFFDITLITEESEIRCHKLILGACSPHFRNIIRRLSSVQNPAIYLRGVRHEDIKNILEFMYLGMVNVAQEDLDSFLSVAQDLCIKGLTQDGQQTSNSSSSVPPPSSSPGMKSTPPPAKRAKLKSNGDNVKSSVPIPKKEPKMDPDCIQIVDESPADDQGDTMEGYEDYYEAGPSDPGAEDGKGYYDADEDDTALEDLSNDGMEQEDGGLLIPIDGEGVLCTICKKVLRDKYTAKRHFLSMHQQNQPKARCVICNKDYKNINSRDAHMLIVHGVKASTMKNAISISHKDS